MAKAKFATPVQKPNVILELTFEEAQAVHLLAGKVSGTGKIRPYTDSVYAALDVFLEEKDRLPYSTFSGTLNVTFNPQEEL